LTIYQWFDLKITSTVFSGLASKPVMKVSPSLASKPIVGFLFEPQNKGGGGFPGFGIKIGSYGLVIWASKSSRWFLCLDIKIKQATVYRLRYKTDGRATAWDTCRDLEFFSQTSRLVDARSRVVHVASSRRLHRLKAEDEWVNTTNCVRPFYHRINIFMY
jgi:hypothetical protein